MAGQGEGEEAGFWTGSFVLLFLGLFLELEADSTSWLPLSTTWSAGFLCRTAAAGGVFSSAPLSSCEGALQPLVGLCGQTPFHARTGDPGALSSLASCCGITNSRDSTAICGAVSSAATGNLTF